MALLLDTLSPLPAFCSPGSGCDEVRRSAFGTLFGIPVSAIGLVAFFSLFSLSFFPSWQTLTARAAIFGGLAGIFLLGLQGFVIHAFCKFCVVVDISAIFAALAGFKLAKATESTRDLAKIAWLGALIAALALPSAWKKLQPPDPAPRTIQALWKSGTVTIVEFSDFECPFCRMAHPLLEEAIRKAKEEGIQIQLIRKTMPLPMHPNARVASHAYLCAEEAGKGHEMAERLFTGSLTKQACSVYARELGIPTEAFDTCMEDARIEAKIDDQIAFVRNSNFQGLPAIWFNENLLLGARDGASYSKAIHDASSGPTKPRGNFWPILLTALTSLGLIAWGLRSAAHQQKEAPNT